MIQVIDLIEQLNGEQPLFNHNGKLIYRQDFLPPLVHLTAWLKAQPQSCWLLYSDDIIRFAQGFFALMAAGKKIVLPPNNKIEQLQNLLGKNKDIEASLGCSQQLSIAGLDQWTTIDATQQPTQILLPHNSEIEFFTSGSSGEAKKIGKTWRQLQQEVFDLNTLWTKSTVNSEFVATVSHQHVYGLLFRLLWPLLNNHTINTKLISYPETLEQLLSQLTTNQRICLISSPAFLNRTADMTFWQQFATKLTRVYSSGGPLSAQAAKQINQKLSNNPVEVFGSTETGGIAWRVQNENTHWQPFSSVVCRIEQSEQSEQKLQLQSPYLPQEYAANNQANNWYTTDDRAKLINGQLQILGRADRIVKIEEKRLSLDELEQTLNQHAWVQQCHAVVLTRPSEQIDRQQIGMVVVLNQQGLDAQQNQKAFLFNQQLKQWLADRFEAVLLPRKWRYVLELTQNSQGKLQKQQMLALFETK